MPTWSIPSFAAWIEPRPRAVSLALCLALLSACGSEPDEIDADVIVIGGGIAGLASSLEASASGASVIGIEQNSVGGGHAVMAVGMFLVGTPLQESKQVSDSPELAMADMLEWGEDAVTDWVSRYVEASRTEVHDWLVNMGVEFALLMPAPGETSVPRFHFTRGTAVNIVVPMMRTALARQNLQWRFNTIATGLRSLASGGWAVETRDTRTGKTMTWRARRVILTTGGFENDLDRVRANWLPNVAQPERLLAGASHFAQGSGLDLGIEAGALLTRLDHQTIFVTGLPNPRDPAGVDGLLAQNPSAIFVDREGKRFMNESAPRKTLEQTVLALPGQSYWLVFDEKGRRRLQVRGAPWLTRDSLEQEILGNPALVSRADNLEKLAAAAGLPADKLALTVAEFNERLALGEADDFGRFGPATTTRPPSPLSEPPFYAMPLYPMTRKSMGGLAIDERGQVLDGEGRPIQGLLAAGEATGVAGINGSYGGSGTFLGPSVFTGRIAGRNAADAPGTERAVLAELEPEITTANKLLDDTALAALLQNSREGYWHFEQAHQLVRERDWSCTDCHSPQWPTAQAHSANEKRVQLESCTRCH
jgi:predicted oxidoreductase